ncbi:MAG: hypothetical protein GY696_31580 [Gammaproteobacteria bacterium]|nr:hypothetical protein [Gammaproteobacteria bacterium]
MPRRDILNKGVEECRVSQKRRTPTTDGNSGIRNYQRKKERETLVSIGRKERSLSQRLRKEGLSKGVEEAKVQPKGALPPL